MSAALRRRAGKGTRADELSVPVKSAFFLVQRVFSLRLHEVVLNSTRQNNAYRDAVHRIFQPWSRPMLYSRTTASACTVALSVWVMTQMHVAASKSRHTGQHSTRIEQALQLSMWPHEINTVSRGLNTQILHICSSRTCCSTCCRTCPSGAHFRWCQQPASSHKLLELPRTATYDQ